MRKPIWLQLRESFGGLWEPVREEYCMGWRWRDETGREVTQHCAVDSWEQPYYVFYGNNGQQVGMEGMIYRTTWT